MRTTTALVERDAQLDVLAAALRDPSGTVVLVAGEAGAGKSALLAAALAGCPDANVWIGRCEPLTIPAPFSALLDTLDRMPAPLAHTLRRGEVAVDAYAAVLDELRRSPTVLVVDDLQWADAATAGLVRYLARRCDQLSRPIVCAYRVDEIADDEAGAAIAELGRLARRVDLPPLTVDGVAELARQLTPDVAVDARHVQAATGGNPLFTVEVLRQPADEVPATVGDIVNERVRRLPIAVQSVVEAVALCPDGIGIDLVVALSPDASEHVDLACQRRLLAVEGQRVRCRHELIRAAIDQSIPPLRRRQTHRRLIALLEPHVASDRDVSLLAHHSAAAGDGPRAVRYSLQAASDAVAAGTHRHAADHLMRALEFREALTADQLDEVLARAADELVLACRYDEAITVAGERVDRADRPRRRVDALAQLAYCWTRMGDYPAGQDAAERAVALAGELGTTAPAVAERVLAGAAMTHGRFPDVVRHCERAIAAAEATGATDDLIAALTNVGTARHVLADPAWEADLRRAFQLAVDADLHDRAAHVVSNLANCLLAHFRLPEARRWFTEALGFCERRQIDAWIQPLVAGSARLELTVGDWDAARAALDTRRWGEGCWGSQAEAQWVLALLALRTSGGAHGDLAGALALADVSGTHWDRVDAAVLAAEAAWLGDGDPDDAAERLRQAAADPAVRHDPWASGRVQFWIRQLGGRLHGAPRAATPGGLPGPFAHLATGDVVAERAAWAALGCPYEAALAAAHAPDPDTVAIAAALRALGAEAARVAVQRDWRGRGIDVRSAGEPRHPSGLTPRQLDVLALVARGRTNAEIGETLFISEKTAGHHVSAILTQLGARNRRAAAATAFEHGWA